MQTCNDFCSVLVSIHSASELLITNTLNVAGVCTLSTIKKPSFCSRKLAAQLSHLVHLSERTLILVGFLYKLIVAALHPDFRRPTGHTYISDLCDLCLFASALATAINTSCVFAGLITPGLRLACWILLSHHAGRKLDNAVLPHGLLGQSY